MTTRSAAPGLAPFPIADNSDKEDIYEAAAAFLRQPKVQPDLRIPYGVEDQQFGDLFLPTTQVQPHPDEQPLPVIVYFHGGCWRKEYTLEPSSALCKSMAEKAQAAVWCLEYRRLGNGGGWPTTFVDAAQGVDYLEAIAARFHLDLDRVILSGHSAGALLALWLAARHNLPKDSPLYPTPTTSAVKIQSVVTLSPVCDLERALAWGVCCRSVAELMGGPPKDVAQRYWQASPSHLLPLKTRHVAICGIKDTMVPIEYVKPFVDLAQKLGDDASLVRMAGAGHFNMLMPHTYPGSQAVQIVAEEVWRTETSLLDYRS